MKTSIYLFGLFSLVQVACGQNKEKKVPMFEWTATMSCPVGYPVDVIEGDLTGNGFNTLKLGTHYGPWGAQGRSWGTSELGLPNKLYAFWISYAEKQFYKIETDIDYEKILIAFEKGYILRNAHDEHKKYQYKYINVGFAPGGVVVLWAQGVRQSVELARYQGEKFSLPEGFGLNFDSHDRLVYDPNYWEDIMANEKIVPIEVQEANKYKSIPIGLWDEYRILYNWKIEFENKDFEIFDVKYEFLNGELKYDLYDTNNFLKPYPKSIPSFILFYARTNENRQFRIKFDIIELTDAFKKLSNERDEEIVMHLRIINNDVMKIILKSGDIEIPIVKSHTESSTSTKFLNK